MRQQLVHAGPSTIANAGTGLFSNCFIEKNTTIEEYTGKILNFEQAKYLRDRTYLKGINMQQHIDGSNGGLAKYINDNTDASKYNVKFQTKDSRVFIVTTRDIQKDEELFIEYGRGHWLFFGVGAFLGLHILDGKLATQRFFDKFETICCYESPSLQDIDGLSDAVVFAQSPQEDANCMLRRSPFVFNSSMICATRKIQPGEIVTLVFDDRLCVKVSSIIGAGLGAFARTVIPLDSVIGYIRGEVISRNQVDTKARQYPETLKALLVLGHDRYLDPSDNKGQLKYFTSPHVCFINHSKEYPNAVLEITDEGGFVVRAIVNIQSHQEIFLDYEKYYFMHHFD